MKLYHFLVDVAQRAMGLRSLAASVAARAARWSAPLVASVALAACGGGGSTAADMPSQSASADDLLMSPPQRSCSYEHVYITVESVRLLQDGVAGRPWREVVLPTPRRIDLVGLHGPLLQALGAPPLPPGHYTEIRLVLADAGNDPLANAIQPAGGSLVPLQVPSGRSSGLKIEGEFVVPATKSGDVALDGFDPCQAVVRAGNSGRYQLTPHLEAHLVFLPNIQVPSPGGGFTVVVFAGDAVYVQRYSAQGEVAGDQVRISLDGVVVGYAGSLKVTPLATGGYALSWLGPPLTPSPFPPFPVMVRTFDASGNPLIAVLQVGTSQMFKSYFVGWPLPVSAALAGGGYVIAWYGPQGSLLSQPFAADGNPIGASRDSALSGLQPQVVGLASGGYMLASGTTRVGTRAYAADGSELGPARIVVSGTPAPMSLVDFTLAALPGGGALLSGTYPVASGPRRPFVLPLAPDGSPVGGPLEIQ